MTDISTDAPLALIAKAAAGFVAALAIEPVLARSGTGTGILGAIAIPFCVALVARRDAALTAAITAAFAFGFVRLVDANGVLATEGSARFFFGVLAASVAAAILGDQIRSRRLSSHDVPRSDHIGDRSPSIGTAGVARTTRRTG